MKNLAPYLFLFTTLFISACQGHKTEKIAIKNDTEYRSISLKPRDSTFLALMDIAQKQLPVFIDSLQKNGSDIKGYSFVVKSDFVEDDNHEHMWSQVYSYDEGELKGIFIDSAFTVKKIKRGDKVSIDTKNVEDWAIYNSSTHKVIGDFSKKYLESKH